MNDTGSNVQTIFPTDLTALRYNQLIYCGRLGMYPISTAGGVVYRRKMVVEIQILKVDGTAITTWLREAAVVTPPRPGV
jgi:hypothetical protein